MGECGVFFCNGKQYNAASVTEQVGSPMPSVVFFTINVNQGGDLVRRPLHFSDVRQKFICSRQVVWGGCTYDVVHLIGHEGVKPSTVPEHSEPEPVDSLFDGASGVSKSSTTGFHLLFAKHFF